MKFYSFAVFMEQNETPCEQDNYNKYSLSLQNIAQRKSVLKEEEVIDFFKQIKAVIYSFERH